VTSLNDPAQAIEAVVNDNFRVVILDMKMPAIGGLQLLEQVKRHDGGIQVIMLTGVVTTTVALESMRLGANDCLFKPLEDGNELMLAVKDSFERIDRWRNRLRYLAERRKADRELCTAP
jgi:DNA-binding NtrC family response regulator